MVFRHTEVLNGRHPRPTPPLGMSADEKVVRPYHAPEAKSGQETADTLKAVLDHAAERAVAAKQKTTGKKQPKWMLLLGPNLGVLALYLLIAPPSIIVMSPLEAPPPEEQIQGLRLAMFLQATRIESYRRDNGQLPASLADAGSPTPGVEYSVVGSSYLLVGTAGNEAMTYDSASQSPQDWVGGVADRLKGG